MDAMTVPDFLIIGPPKCGTTALYVALARHPQVFMSRVKEPNFFAFEGRPLQFAGPDGAALQHQGLMDWEQYTNLFTPGSSASAVGEASTIYLTDYQPKQTAEHIHRRIPGVRLIALLRHPADRAYSHFAFRRQRGYEPLSGFDQALKAEDQRIAAGWSPYSRYRRNGFYARNLKPYVEMFPREQIRLYLYDEWCNQPHVVLRDLSTFLGIDPMVATDPVERINVTTWPRSRVLYRISSNGHAFKSFFPKSARRKLASWLRMWNETKPPGIDPALRCELTDSYRSDILDLQDMTGFDLSHWITLS
jgi:hypothetical protein